MAEGKGGEGPEGLKTMHRFLVNRAPRIEHIPSQYWGFVDPI
jgi:hypothetical protein